MNARITIFKHDYALKSHSRESIYLYSFAVLALLIGITSLQRFLLSPTYAALRNTAPAERRHIAFAEEICRKLVPEVGYFQVGLVTRSEPPHADKGLVSVQLSDRDERHHFHVIRESKTGELVVLSQVVRKGRNDLVEPDADRHGPSVKDTRSSYRQALETARQALNILSESGAIPNRELLGVTVEHPGNWIVQWHYRDCCIVMDIRPSEKRMATFRLRRHPRRISESKQGLRAGRCTTCVGFGKTSEYNVQPLHNP